MNILKTPTICLLGLILISAAAANDEVVVRRTDDKAAIENSRISIEFDLAKGTFRAIDRRDGSEAFREGCLQVGQWTSTKEGTTCRATDDIATDGLGKGKTLSLECSREKQPTLLFEITLYPDKSFAVLRAGILNTTPQSYRIKDFYPLTAARAFPDVSEIHQAKTLNAEGGGRNTFVQSGAARASSNNVLTTFHDGKRRRTLVLGGLAYHEWMKSAATWPTASPPFGNDVRRRELAAKITAAGGTLAAYLDCGPQQSAGSAPGVELRALTGKPYDFASVFAAPCYNTVLFDNKQVELEAAGLDRQKRYLLGFSWWDYSTDGRVESVYVEPGEGGLKTALLEKAKLPGYAKVREQLPEEKMFTVPQAAYASGKMKIDFALDSANPGSNAVVSEVWLIEGPPELAAKIGSPATESAKQAEKEIYLHLQASDPVGRLVFPGERYRPEDRFYVDFATDDPFEAAEQYGLAVRAAQGAQPNPYIFPTICSWYAGVTFEPDAQNHPEKSKYGIATTKGQVEEMDYIRGKTDFLNYSTIALRLVPDNYTPNNPQGWWDDQHWQEQGFYAAPYETTEKWGKALLSRGGLAFTYFQSDRVSADFRKAHPELLLSGNRAFDYTNPDTREYLRKVYAAMRGNVAGMMFDYCDELWCFNLSPGGFHDERATAASVYRLVFEFAKTGLGPHSWIHERPIDNPGSDMAVGLIDSQRTSGDTASISPALLARTGLRWYKNRVLFAYDMDSKSLVNAWKDPSFQGTDEDGRRMTLTMAYVAASRLLLANSFRDLSPEAIHDLERTVPYHWQPKSARPVDAFVNPGPPRIYDFAVRPDWHQLTLFNTDGAKTAEFAVALSGEMASGALGLDPKAEYYFYDFWNDGLAGKIRGGDTLKQTLRAGEARMLSVHRAEPNPQFLATNRHLMQGYVDLAEIPRWDAKTRTLNGISKVVGGAAYQIIVADNGHKAKTVKAQGATAKIEPLPGAKGLSRITLESPKNADVSWTIGF
jgi:hypothetical protein